MKIEILSVKENPLMKRKELYGIIEHDGMPTPSKASVQKYLSKEQKVPEKHVDIRKIFSARGREDAKLIAYIWEEKEVPVLEDKKIQETKESSETGKEEKKVETKPEKEESKAEPKKEEEQKSEEKKPETKPEETEKKE